MPNSSYKCINSNDEKYFIMQNISKPELMKYKKINEKFIYALEGNIILNFVQTPPYSFLSYPSYDYLLPILYNIPLRGMFCITDKRVILLERTPDENTPSNVVRSFNFNEITIKYKKKLGMRTFILYKNQYNFFDYSEISIDFEVNSNLIKEADRINDMIKEILRPKSS